MVSPDNGVHRTLMRRVLGWTARMDLAAPPPAMGQRIHRHLRQISGNSDPYRQAKRRQNRLALGMLPALREKIRRAPDPLDRALRLAAAGNVIDLGVGAALDLEAVGRTIEGSLEWPLDYDRRRLGAMLRSAKSILYLADNAGEIVFDRLLIEQLPRGKVTLAVRGGPVINDATLDDARQAGLMKVCRVIDNGSDAPGTILGDCSPGFRREFSRAGLVISKGQGNYETLSRSARDIIFLFQAKCPVVAEKVGRPLGSRLCLITQRGKKQ
jgi:hypothetical protein